MKVLSAIWAAFTAFWMPTMFDGNGREVSEL